MHYRRSKQPGRKGEVGDCFPKFPSHINSCERMMSWFTPTGRCTIIQRPISSTKTTHISVRRSFSMFPSQPVTDPSRKTESFRRIFPSLWDSSGAVRGHERRAQSEGAGLCRYDVFPHVQLGARCRGSDTQSIDGRNNLPVHAS